MPIDVNKIVPNKNLAILDGLLKGIGGMKKAEEEKQQLFIKNMFEQFKLQNETRKTDIDERKAITEEQKTTNAYYKDLADIDNAKNKVAVDIETNKISRDRLIEEIRQNDPVNYRRLEDIKNESKYTFEVKTTKENEIMKDSLAQQAEKRKAGLDLQYKHGATEIPVGGTFGVESRQKEKELGITNISRERVANAQMANQNAIAEMNRLVDLQIAGMNITSRENIAEATKGLKGNANVDIGTYNKGNLDFNEDYTRQLELAGDKPEKIVPAVMDRLNSKLQNSVATYQALRAMYPDRYIIPPNLEMGTINTKAHFYGGVKQVPAFVPAKTIKKTAPITQGNTSSDSDAKIFISSFGATLKGMTKEEAKKYFSSWKDQATANKILELYYGK